MFGTVECFTLYSGLKINYDKTEVMLLGKQKLNPATLLTCSGKDITIKKAIKILGVYFTYHQFLWKKLDFGETLKSISEKLRFWKKLPRFYEECFQIFAEHSAATAVSVQYQSEHNRLVE